MAGAASAQSQSAVNLKTFDQWTAWQDNNDEDGQVCFVTANPTDTQPKEVNGKPINRDPPAFVVLHRKSKGLFNEAQTLIGYPFDTTKFPVVLIDGAAHTMVAEKSAAWLAKDEDEAAFVAAMKAGSKLVVKGTSLKGTQTTDTYSLAGFTAAMQTIDKACPHT